MWFRKRKDNEETPRAWTVQPVTRMTDAREGQAVEYPVRLAVCPRGHARSLPTRFSQPVQSLRCEACNRSYPIEL